VLPLNELTRAEVAQAADANFVIHASWVQQRTPGMRADIARDLVLVDCGMPCDTFNLVCRARLEPAGARKRIREAIDGFAGHPFSWWLGPADQPAELGALLLEAGLQRADSELAMAADLARLRDSELSPGGLLVRRVRSPADLRAFAAILAAGWDPPDADLLRFYERAAPVLLADDSPLWVYVGYLGDTPVASAELSVGGGVAGLYNIVTLEAYRRRGIGSAMTLRPLLDARDASQHIGVLQAAAAGVNMYTRLGFETFGEITEYKPASSSPQ
jgi:ribosomal protein S18 acetylase RimI-like enzyme